MSNVTRLNDAGFVVELISPDRIGITPAEQLTDLHANGCNRTGPPYWFELKEHSANDRRRLDRCRWFLSLAKEHDIHPDVVAGEFPAPDGILDVIKLPERDDHRFRKCMARLCADAKVQQSQQDYESRRWVPNNQDSEQMP